MVPRQIKYWMRKAAEGDWKLFWSIKDAREKLKKWRLDFAIPSGRMAGFRRFPPVVRLVTERVCKWRGR